MSDFLMPKLGSDMTAGTLVAWRKKPNDPVHRGDIMAEVDTDKGVIDIEAFSEGLLESILVQPGTKVPVGTPLATIRDAAGVAAPTTATPSAATPTAAPEMPSEQFAPQPALNARPQESLTAQELRQLRISPSARLRARELNVDPRTVQGTGRGGAITREDIDQAACARGAAPAPSSPSAAEPLDRAARMRQAIAAAMSRANREIPHYYLSTTIDLQRALAWLTQENEKRPVTDRLLYGVLLLKAVALALREVPQLNAVWESDRAILKESIHLGVAISLRGGGLIAPALHDVDRKSLNDLMRELRDLVNRARGGGLRSSELSDATVTVTNLGEQGVEATFGVIYPPQVALVGFGKVVDRPWCVDGQIVVRPLVCASLAGDHRATDGHRGGIFLTALERLLQEPEKL